jgi:hypothetical protein
LEVEILDAAMSRSSDRIVSSPTHDLRPLYPVTGRIRNNSTFTARSLRVRISVLDTTMKEVDGTELDIKTPIPPGSVRAFDQQIQIMPPGGKWTWNYDVVSVETAQ